MALAVASVAAGMQVLGIALSSFVTSIAAPGCYAFPIRAVSCAAASTVALGLLGWLADPDQLLKGTRRLTVPHLPLAGILHVHAQRQESLQSISSSS